MTRYRLKKDAPAIKAGEIFTECAGCMYDHLDQYRFNKSDVANFSDWFEEIPDGKTDNKLNDPLPRYENLVRWVRIYKVTDDSVEYNNRRERNAYTSAAAGLLDYAKWMSQSAKRIKDEGLEAVINKESLTIEGPLDPHTFEVALRAAADCALRMIYEIDEADDIDDLERTAEEARWD